MKKIFEKHETLFCILLIVFYIIVNSYCIQNFGIEDYRSTIINTIFSLVLIFVIVKLKRVSYYGLAKVSNLKRYLYSSSCISNPSIFSSTIFSKSL